MDEQPDDIRGCIEVHPQEEEWLSQVTHPVKLTEFYCSRILASSLCEQIGIPYKGMVKDEFGKPYLHGYKTRVSISHSGNYSAVIVGRNEDVGIDIQKYTPKIMNICNRVLSPSELEFVDNNIISCCICWGAKEVLYKIHGRKRLDFRKHLKILPFSPHHQGTLFGEIIEEDGVAERYMLEYRMNEEYMIVFNP